MEIQTMTMKKMGKQIWTVSNSSAFTNNMWLMGTIFSKTLVHVGSSGKPKDVCYQAASPDENSLVAAARYFGFYFHTREHNMLTVEIMGQDQTFEILNILEFTSNRKRMSVIVRYILY